MSEIPEVYGSVESMEPLMPTNGSGHLSELVCAILRESGRLVGQVHSPLVRARIGDLARTMNCYYSNLIEGHKTMPHDIERALKKDFSEDSKSRDNQKLSASHIQVEFQLAAKLGSGLSPYAPEFIRWLHREFYQGLPESLHWSETKSGRRYRVEPSQLRHFMVDISHHTPPHFDVLPAFLDRFAKYYGSEKILETNRLIAIAAAHHRLAWIHPFGDGNGRVVRLHSQALLMHHGMSGEGLWTLSRGLARTRDEYYGRLNNADCKRLNDLDGRGNLSDQALADFCRYFLETMLDQITFMAGLLNLPALRSRIEKCFQFADLNIPRYRSELMRVVQVLADEGEIHRSRVLEITGKSSATVAALIKLGLGEGFFTSPSPKGPLQIAFPEKLRSYYFPDLYLNLPIDSGI